MPFWKGHSASSACPALLTVVCWRRWRWRWRPSLQPAPPRSLCRHALPGRDPGLPVAGLSRNSCCSAVWPRSSVVCSAFAGTGRSMPGWRSCSPSPLPSPSLWPAVQGMAVGLLLLFGFAVPPLLQLRRVPTLRVLRRELGAPGGALLGGYALGAGGLAAVMVWVAGDVVLGGWVVGGFVAALAFFYTARVWPSGWRRGCVAGRMPLPASAGATASPIWSGTHSAAWCRSCARAGADGPAAADGDAWGPARCVATRDSAGRAESFVINIQPEQVVAVGNGFRCRHRERIVPMVRGRMTELNGRTVGVADYEDDRAKRLIDRSSISRGGPICLTVTASCRGTGLRRQR